MKALDEFGIKKRLLFQENQEPFCFKNFLNSVTSSAFRADLKFFQRCAGLLADEFQLIDRGEELAAFCAGLHLEGAAPDFAFVAGGAHFDVSGGTDVSASAAADADIRLFMIGRADLLLRTSTKKSDGADADNFLAHAHAGTA